MNTADDREERQVTNSRTDLMLTRRELCAGQRTASRMKSSASEPARPEDLLN